MSRSSHFFGQSVFGQLISLIDNSIIVNSVKKYNSDRYVKRFTTISLFQDILKCVGRKTNNCKSKGGIKVHTIINGLFNSYCKYLSFLLYKLKLNANITYLFDKGYNDYKVLKKCY
jgi:hypothetical protein